MSKTTLSKFGVKITYETPSWKFYIVCILICFMVIFGVVKFTKYQQNITIQAEKIRNENKILSIPRNHEDCLTTGKCNREDLENLKTSLQDKENQETEKLKVISQNLENIKNDRQTRDKYEEVYNKNVK